MMTLSSRERLLTVRTALQPDEEERRIQVPTLCLHCALQSLCSCGKACWGSRWIRSALLLVVLFFFGKQFFALPLDRKLALASGINATQAFHVLLFLVAIIVAGSLCITGGLLIYVLMILPASAAFQWAYDIRKALLIAPLLGMLTSLSGFFLSLGADLPIGASIVLCCSAVSLLCAVVPQEATEEADDGLLRSLFVVPGASSM